MWKLLPGDEWIVCIRTPPSLHRSALFPINLSIITQLSSHDLYLCHYLLNNTASPSSMYLFHSPHFFRRTDWLWEAFFLFDRRDPFLISKGRNLAIAKQIKITEIFAASGREVGSHCCSEIRIDHQTLSYHDRARRLWCIYSRRIDPAYVKYLQRLQISSWSSPTPR